MPWTHTCRLPGFIRIKLRRAGVGQEYLCICGKYYTLSVRVEESTGKMYYRWNLQDEETDVSSTTSAAKPSTGFQANNS